MAAGDQEGDVHRAAADDEVAGNGVVAQPLLAFASELHGPGVPARRPEGRFADESGAEADGEDRGR